MAGKKNEVTYGMYVQAREAMAREGLSNPSVHDMVARIGGSNSTILKHLRRWNDEKTISGKPNNISEGLMQSLTAEIARVSQKAREELEEVLTLERKQIKDYEHLLSEAESKINELDAERELERETMQANILDFQKKLATADEQTNELKRQNEKLEGQLKESIIAQDSARVEAAKSQLQLDRAYKDTEKAEKNIKELLEKLAQLQESGKQSEIKAAVAETCVKELEKQLLKSK